MPRPDAGAVATDGSSVEDVEPRVRIDRNDEIDRMRWRCPNNHTRWTPTNNHVYCHSCAQIADADEGPEYWELHDAKTGESVDWSRIVFE